MNKEALKEREEKIRLLTEDVLVLEDYVHDLFGFSPVPICLISPKNIILEINPSFEEITSFSPNDLVGKDIERILESGREIGRRALKGRAIDHEEALLITKDGSRIPVQIFARARKNESNVVVGYFLGAYNLTDIKRTEEELRRSQTALLNILEDTEESRQKAEEEGRKTQSVIENLSDGLIVLDKKYRILFINQIAESFFNIRGKEVSGKRLEDLSGHRPRLLVEALNKKDKDISFSRERLDIDENLILEVSNVVMDSNAQEVGHLLILHDVTREKLVEKLKTEFVSISAHQLRTPLSAIKWSLQMLASGDMGLLNEEQKEFVRKTYDSNERMISLVNSLLNVTRIEEGRFVYRAKSVDIVDLIEQTISPYRMVAERKGVNLQFSRPGKVIMIKVDSEKLGIAVQNLIDNAIKYTLHGKSVRVSLKEEKGHILFSVTDEGVGIPKDQQERIFSKFFRASNVVKLETVGAGLGLFITKNIVESHGGSIHFKSKDGEGTTFWFTLPIST